MRLMKKELTERYDDAKELIEALVNVMALLIERGRIEPRLGAVGLLGPTPSTSSPNLKPLMSAPSGRGSQVTISPVASKAPLVGVDARAATVDARVNSESGAIRLPQPAARGNRLAAIAATVLAILSLIVVIFVVMGRSPKRGVNVGPDGGVLAAGTGSGEQVQGASEDDDKINGALASIDKGDYGTGIATLTHLGPADMGRADVHRALMKAYLATSATADAMREAGLLVKADPGVGLGSEAPRGRS